MHLGEQRLLISMIEEEYSSHRHTSFSATVYTITNGFEMSDEDLFRKLKRDHNIQPTGRMSRVVTKRVYNACERSDAGVIETIESVSQSVDLNGREISDDLLCRNLE